MLSALLNQTFPSFLATSVIANNNHCKNVVRYHCTRNANLINSLISGWNVNMLSENFFNSKL